MIGGKYIFLYLFDKYKTIYFSNVDLAFHKRLHTHDKNLKAISIDGKLSACRSYFINQSRFPQRGQYR